MSTSDQLRQNLSQHSPKNTLSKGDDRKIAIVMADVVAYLNDRFMLSNLGFYLEYVRSISEINMKRCTSEYSCRISLLARIGFHYFARSESKITRFSTFSKREMSN